MEKDFKSKALEVNLSNTKQESVNLPEDHNYFLSLSKEYYGIHKYTSEYFAEFHHNYPNYSDIAIRIRKIAVGDYWLYEKAADDDKALRIIADMIKELLAKNSDKDIKTDLVRTLIEFTGIVSSPRKSHDELSERCILMISETLKTDREAVLVNSETVRNQISHLISRKENDFGYRELYSKICRSVVDYWKETASIEKWIEGKERLFTDDSLRSLEKLGSGLFHQYYEILDKFDDTESLEKNIPLYFEFSSFYKNYAKVLKSSVDKFHYLVFLLDLPGMRHQKDHLMYDLKIILGNIFSELAEKETLPFLNDVFDVFKELIKTNKLSVLACVKTIGIKLAELKDFPTCKYFADKVLNLGFIGPGPSFRTEDWRMRVDPAHVVNIRTWLEIFESDTEKYEMLLAGLTANLKLGGVLIFDTDLFQKDVTKLLNSDIKGSFKQVKQLCRIFPIYFSEIGAEGELRDVTTEIDELCFRQDRLIHFLRKQVHTESNNTHIGLTRAIFDFWVTKNKIQLKDILPADVYASIDEGGIFVEPLHQLIRQVSEVSGFRQEEIIIQDPEKIEKWAQNAEGVSENDKKRLKLICRLYDMLVEKYSFSTVDICSYLRKYNIPSGEKTDTLENALKEGKTEKALRTVYEIMEQLNDIIFSEKKTEGWENIYYKRHVAYGIPSMYGAYHEERFESLGKIFKLEHLANRLISDLRGEINLSYMTAGSLQKIHKVLQFYQRGLQIDGISIKELDHNMEMFRYSLTSKSFSLGQHINMFRFIGESIREIIKKYFFKPYDNPLKIIIPKLFYSDDVPDGKKLESVINKKAEEFYRDMLSSAFLLQGLDSFISEILTAMHNMVENYTPETVRDIMSFDNDMIVSPLYSRTANLDNHVFLGQKANNLKKLYLSNFPVPPGFVITTEMFRRKNTIFEHPGLLGDFDKAIRHNLKKVEKITGKQLGNKDNPLLLSVRSGAAISMPGAMNTFLNVGVNLEVIEGLSRKDNYGWTAWDCYRRFLQTWGMSYGIDRDVFDRVILDHKKSHGIGLKAEFSPVQMRELAMKYLKVLEENNVRVENDPYLQLRQTIINVFNSWNSELAKTYRKILDIADEWGTAVIVQNMVLGNLNYTSGTGVVFTHADYSPKKGINLNGDYTSVSQGEDIVGGLVSPLPVSSDQPYSGTPESSLEKVFPAIYSRLKNICTELIEKQGFNHQEIEFTFESDDPDDLYILQTRDQNMNLSDEITVFENPIDPAMMLGSGIGIGSGVMNGVIIFDEEDLEEFRNKCTDKKMILVRPDTVPDDIGLIYECEGLITARGGSTSHAAVTAARLGKICIVNAMNLSVDEKKKVCRFNGEIFGPGDELAIDGNKGFIYKGNYPVAVLK